MERLLDLRYPPYSTAKLKQLKLMTSSAPNFDREGKTTSSFSWWLMGLGGTSKAGAAARWVVIVLVAVAIRMWRMKG